MGCVGGVVSEVFGGGAVCQTALSQSPADIP